MSTFFPGASGLIINGGTFNASTNIRQSKRGIDFLMDWLATDAMHNSDELYDAPKCHPHTRVAVLDDIMNWVISSDSKTQEEFMMWLFGAAGAGKSAIAKKIAELAAEKGLLIGSFFFSKTSSKRNTKDRLIPTLAYQMALSIPGCRTHIEHAIETDPAIFHKDIQTQIDTLLLKPYQSASSQTIPWPKLIIIDGLDECSDSQAQVTILDAISRAFTTHKLPIICLVVSRPETDIVSSFNGNEPLKFIHRRLALDDTYHPDDDIRRFFVDKFNHIRYNHRLKSTIPLPWPTNESLERLVKKSSGQFIFAATVVRFVESNRHRPASRLDIILGVSPPGSINPFTELDALYKQILFSVDDVPLTLRVLSFYVLLPALVVQLGKISEYEHYLSLEEGDIDLALIDLSSIVSYNESSGEFKILHASLVDFMFDKRRSNEFYIDMAKARTDFTCRTLQFVKGPDGIRAGDRYVFSAGLSEGGWIISGQLRDEILNFDLDAFITAATKSPYVVRINIISSILKFWMDLIPKMGLEDGDQQLLIGQCRNSFESRMQKYDSHWRLQLLLTLAVVKDSSFYQYPQQKHLDILLEMDDHDLHLVDQDALDLRYSNGYFANYTHGLRDIISCYVDNDRYASAALHCMRFLSNPPKYSERNGNPEIGITYREWKTTCRMALDLLHTLLERIIPTPEVIQILTEYQINPTLREIFPGSCVETRILEFLRRATDDEYKP